MSTAGSTLSGAASGAATGAAFGPWGAAIGGVVGGAAGFFSGRSAEKEKEEAQSIFEKNKYGVPPSMRAALQNAERQAEGVRLPAEDLRRAQLQQSTAQGVGMAQNVATSSSDVQAMLAQLYGNQTMAEQGMGIEAANRFDENQRQLQRAQQAMAGWQDTEWQQNVLAPYNQQLAQAEIMGDRSANTMSGLMDFAGTLGSAYLQTKGAQGRQGEYMDYMRGSNNQFGSTQFNNNVGYGYKDELLPITFGK